MRNKGMLRKIVCLMVVFCFASSALFSQALALEQEEQLLRKETNSPAFERLFECLASPGSCIQETCIDEEDLPVIGVTDTDAAGWVVLYNIFMFIYYGRLCLETLDPGPCRAMVNHLFWALFLGVLLEAF